MTADEQRDGTIHGAAIVKRKQRRNDGLDSKRSSDVTIKFGEDRYGDNDFSYGFRWNIVPVNRIRAPPLRIRSPASTYRRSRSATGRDANIRFPRETRRNSVSHYGRFANTRRLFRVKNALNFFPFTPLRQNTFVRNIFAQYAGPGFEENYSFGKLPFPERVNVSRSAKPIKPTRTFRRGFGSFQPFA